MGLLKLYMKAVQKIFVCNVATQLSETDNFNAADHFMEIKKYTNNLKLITFLLMIVLMNWEMTFQQVQLLNWVNFLI